MYNPSFQGDVCSYRHAFVLDNVIRRLLQSPKKIVGPYISSGHTVIDLGCGPGYFTIEMARMVGETGRVIAVDIQNEMLAKVAGKAALLNLEERIFFHHSTQDAIGLGENVTADFILAYYMVHETRDQGAFFSQIRNLIADDGLVLIVEPPFHVTSREFEQMARIAQKSGFTIADRPSRKGGKSLLLAAAEQPVETEANPNSTN